MNHAQLDILLNKNVHIKYSLVGADVEIPWEQYGQAKTLIPFPLSS